MATQRARKTVAAPRTPARRPAAQAEAESPDGYIEIEHVGMTWRVLPASEWPVSATAAAGRGMVDEWARLVIHADYHRQWIETDMTMREWADMSRVIADAAGGDAMGEATRSAISSSRMRSR